MSEPNFLSVNEAREVVTLLDSLNALDYQVMYVHNVSVRDINGEVFGTIDYDGHQKTYVFYMGEKTDD